MPPLVTTPLTIVSDESVRWIRDRWSITTTAAAGAAPVFGFINIPFDYAVSHRPGCRFGPEKIIEALNACSAYCTDKRTSLTDATFVHCGAIEAWHDISESYRRIQKAVAAMPRGFNPIMLGGDHSTSDPSFRGVVDRIGNQRLGLIVFDAHFDSRVPVRGREHSGHWLHTLSDVLNYRGAAQLGINAPIYSEGYMTDAEGKGILVMTPYEIRRLGWAAALKRTVDHVMKVADCVYLSVDIDAIDQAYAPGTSVPNVGGLLAHEVIDAVFDIAADIPVAGFDITEVSPPLDTGDSTSRLAAQIVMNYMAGTVRRTTR